MNRKITISLILFLIINLSALQVLAYESNGESACLHENLDDTYYVYQDNNYHKACWTCLDCGKQLSDEEARARYGEILEKHEPDGDWEIERKATVFKTGIKTNYCVTCGSQITKSISKIKPFAKFKRKSYSVTVKKSLTMKTRLKMGRGDSVKKWKVNKKSIAAINKSGKLIGKKTGKVKVTAILKSGKKATCIVTVKRPKPVKVYWVPSGSVYHKRRDCPTLSRSKVVRSGTIKQSGKKRCCKVCG